MSKIFANIRHLRAISEVAKYQSVSKASETMFLSQPAITQAIAKFEELLGVSLFDRRSGGMFLSEVGEIFTGRINRSLSLVEGGCKEAARISRQIDQNAGSGEFAHLLTTVQLRALIAVSEAGNFSLAARLEGVTQPSLHRAARDIERLSGLQFYRKTREGIELTEAARVLARSAKLAFVELDQGYAEIEEWLGRDTGKLVVGAMPLARASVLPTAINMLTQSYPAVDFKIVDGPYDSLLHGLRHGEMDFLVGALRFPMPIEDVAQEVLFEDTLSIAVRPGHPLTKLKEVTIEDLAAYPWVVPGQGAPAREEFRNMFERHGVEEPQGLVEASSLMFVRNLLMESDRVTMISTFQIKQEFKLGLLDKVSFDISDTNRPIGLTFRKNWKPTSMQTRFVEHVREASKA